jgi:hypothetical protein
MLVRRCSGKGSFDSLDDYIKAGRVVYRNFAEHLAVQLDMGLFAAVDELAVPDAALPTGSTQTHDPQTPEISFPSLTVDASIDCCPDGGFFGLTIQVASGGPITFDSF